MTIRIGSIAALLLAAMPTILQAQETTTRTLPGGATVTNTRGISNGTYTDERTIAGPHGGLVTNDKTVGHGSYVDTRNAAGPRGGTYESTRTASNGIVTHDYSGVTAGGKGFSGSTEHAAGLGAHEGGRGGDHGGDHGRR